MKLVLTGHDAQGRSVFHHAGTPPRSSAPGSYELWSTRGGIEMPDPTPADAPASIGYFPVEGESCFKIVSVPGLRDRPAAGGSFEMPAELQKHFDPDDPEMHTTDTIDYVVVLGGGADLELDDGRKESVAAGDCVVQRGTRHAWRVTSDEPLILAATLIGARRIQST